MKKTHSNTKSKIVTAAWKLFYKQGFDNTTIDDIIFESQTSKGSFYHYFKSKDGLLGSLADLFDEKYEQLSQELDKEANSIDTLLYLNKELFAMIEDSIDMELLTRLYSTQLTTRGEKELLDHKRLYFRLLRSIVLEGQRKGELTTEKTASEIVKLYAMCERGLLYDWCLCGGEYSLKEYSTFVMQLMLSGLKI